MGNDISATIPEPVDVLRDVYLTPNPPGTFRFLEAVVEYQTNQITFDQLAEWVRRWRHAPLLGLVDLGFHGSEDAYPQPGTYHELMVARSLGLLTRDEYRTLDGVFDRRAKPRPESP